jgi:hypothetical protein
MKHLIPTITILVAAFALPSRGESPGGSPLSTVEQAGLLHDSHIERQALTPRLSTAATEVPESNKRVGRLIERTLVLGGLAIMVAVLVAAIASQ